MDTIKTKLLNIHFLVRFQPEIDPTLWKLILLLFTKSGSGGVFEGGGAGPQGQLCGSSTFIRKFKIKLKFWGSFVGEADKLTPCPPPRFRHCKCVNIDICGC